MSVLAYALAWLSLQGGESHSVFPSTANVVSVDVFVADGHGRAVCGLSQHDFLIAEHGRPQTILTFQALEVGSSATDSQQNPGSAPRQAVSVGATQRAFVVVVDDLHMGLAHAARARTAIRALLDAAATDGDSLTLIAPGARIWSTERLPEGRERLLSLGGTITGLWGQWANTPPLPVELRSMRTRVIDAMDSGLLSLEGAAGQRAVFLVSRGFSYLGMGEDARRQYERLLQSSRRVNAPVYFLDVRGLEPFDLDRPERMLGLPLGSSLRALDNTSFMDGLAVDSGGLAIRHANDFSKPMMRLLDDTRCYYSIGYTPDKPPRPGRFQRITVQVKRPGLNARARRGYYG